MQVKSPSQNMFNCEERGKKKKKKKKNTLQTFSDSKVRRYKFTLQGFLHVPVKKIPWGEFCLLLMGTADFFFPRRWSYPFFYRWIPNFYSFTVFPCALIETISTIKKGHFDVFLKSKINLFCLKMGLYSYITWVS